MDNYPNPLLNDGTPPNQLREDLQKVSDEVEAIYNQGLTPEQIRERRVLRFFARMGAADIADFHLWVSMPLKDIEQAISVLVEQGKLAKHDRPNSYRITWKGIRSAHEKSFLGELMGVTPLRDKNSLAANILADLEKLNRPTFSGAEEAHRLFSRLWKELFKNCVPGSEAAEFARKYQIQGGPRQIINYPNPLLKMRVSSGTLDEYEAVLLPTSYEQIQEELKKIRDHHTNQIDLMGFVFPIGNKTFKDPAEAYRCFRDAWEMFFQHCEPESPGYEFAKKYDLKNVAKRIDCQMGIQFDEYYGPDSSRRSGWKKKLSSLAAGAEAVKATGQFLTWGEKEDAKASVPPELETGLG